MLVHPQHLALPNTLQPISTTRCHDTCSQASRTPFASSGIHCPDPATNAVATTGSVFLYYSLSQSTHTPIGPLIANLVPVFDVRNAATTTMPTAAHLHVATPDRHQYCLRLNASQLGEILANLFSNLSFSEVQTSSHVGRYLNRRRYVIR